MPIGLLLPWAIQRGWSPARRGGGAGTARTWARSTWRLGTPAWTRGADTASRPAKRAVGHRHHGIPHPRRQVHLSPAINCFNGMPVGWSIGTPPNAVLANSSLLRACSQLAYGEHHWVHSDRGSHYRWPGWIAICDGHGIVRSMTRKGLGRCCHGGVHGDAGRLSVLVPRQAPQERPGLYEPDAVPKKPRSCSVGTQSGVSTAVPGVQFSLDRSSPPGAQRRGVVPPQARRGRHRCRAEGRLHGQAR